LRAQAHEESRPSLGLQLELSAEARAGWNVGGMDEGDGVEGPSPQVGSRRWDGAVRGGEVVVGWASHRCGGVMS